MKVKLAPRAQQRARTIQTWWLRNRPGAAALFQQEYEQVIHRLESMSPQGPLGTRYKVSRREQIWRVRLPGTEQNVYYSIDEANDTVVIRMIWGAKRGRQPKL